MNNQQCHNCKHLLNYSDELGSGPDCCSAVPGEVDGVSEQASVMFEAILFALSSVSNCPMYANKYTVRTDGAKSIAELKR